MISIDDLKFDEKGLIPVVVQDAFSKNVLTLAYMNRESLEITIREKKTCFWSRSRKELWRKGETSGNIQNVINIKADCDRDALTVLVDKKGPACHLGRDSCFQDIIFETGNEFDINGLYDMLLSRKREMPQGSYTSYLFEKGIDKILKKIGEESTEVIIAAKANDKADTVYETADLIYHVLVMMVQMGIDVEEVKRELASRHIIDSKVKQEKMTL